MWCSPRIDPVRPATTSATMIARSDSRLHRIRRLADGRRRFDGRLSGTIAERARASLAAGCDLVLHCNGKIDEMRAGRVEASAACRRRAAARRCGAGCAQVALPGLILRRRAREFAAMMTCRSPDERRRAFRNALPPSAAPTSRRWWSTSRASRARSTCCWRWPASRRSISPKISILALAEQYLAFIEEARKLRLELAADYLVMAAWLAYLKSRLLLPEPATPTGRPPRTWPMRSPGG